MLISISKVTYIMVIIVGIGEEKVSFGKNIRTTHINAWQMKIFRILGRNHIFIFIGKASSRFVP